ncbi:type VI secretion system Vgr family protein [Massilia scottii]|uniref:type VI secretion system Vgr family protein n=1 Tax=Massilia scottii TaxID=3057166 RepID=UPI00279647C4|nr:type VI secretion system tip protein TssI/VgrG [Massilia sp. CCM 9029]MDQ1829736.1 type VI secretion system tip protein TssI/VgrG [Massilia sp. CCM 9029]
MSLQDMVADRQNNRLLRLSFPNNDGPATPLLVNAIEAYESLSRPFEFTVELLSDAPHLALKDVQGKLMCVELVRRDGSMRYFTGRVFSFGLKRVDGGVSFYEARLGPWYKYLSMRKDNYLFHYTTMYDQTASIFGDYGSLAEWDWRVHGATEVLTDCCQFDESDRNFLERRWVASGIFYWFEHSASGHKLVLSDDSTAAAPIDGNPEIPFQRHAGTVQEDGIGEWSPARQIVTGSVALASYDFKFPHPAFSSLPTLNEQGDVPDIESYEYTGALGFKGGEGRTLAQLRMEEVEARGKQFDGSGNCRAAMPGRWFRLSGHFDASESGDDAQAREFLITAVRHSASNNYHVRLAQASHYENELSCIRKIIPYRAGRDHNSVETRIHGIQTATVVGPAGEEIHTDEYGRVRVQFHWDRAGASDEKSSAWIRVATPWAGANFGMTAIPRIGTEVLVQFLDGNPNRPIITGMVPNANTMPPWPLPANKTQSGVLTRSTPGGSYDNANALRFEDKKGQEQLWLHAEKDQLTEVEHDEDKWVGNDRRKTIDRDETTRVKRDRTETVDRDETITVHNNRKERVDRDESVSIGENRSEDVGKNETISIGSNRTETVGKDETVTIGGSRKVTVKRMKTETVALAKMLTIGGAYQTTVGAAMNTTVGLMQSEQVGLSKSVNVGVKTSFTVGEEFRIDVGDSSFVMKKDGRIEIFGKEIVINGSKKVELHGDDVDINPKT